MKPLLAVVALLTGSSFASGAESVGLLVSAEDLASQRDKSGVILLDVRSREDFAAGHLPGALWVDVDDWKNQSLSPGGLTDEAAWRKRVGELGITRNANVVVYGGKLTDATRVWWTLKYAGVQHVGLLDGGFDAWVDTGAAVIREITAVEAVDFQPEFQTDRLASRDEVQALLEENAVVVIDTRSADEFDGRAGPGERKGRIPGAVHQEWKEFVTEQGRFKPVAEIQELLKSRGLTPDTRAVTHCHSGGRASLNAFAMELAGYRPVKNYYCGWSEWSHTEDAPIEAPTR